MFVYLMLFIIIVIISILNLKYLIKSNKVSSKKSSLEIRNALSKFLEDTSNNWNYILPTELYKENLSKYFLLDIRKNKDYNKGHIDGAINIYWKDLLKEKNLKKLPFNKEIIIICYVGHTSSQVLVLLKLLGYNVRALKFGMGISPVKSVKIAGWNSYGYKTKKISN